VPLRSVHELEVFLAVYSKTKLRTRRLKEDELDEDFLTGTSDFHFLASTINFYLIFIGFIGDFVESFPPRHVFGAIEALAAFSAAIRAKR
jgi:hypothetical protein